MHNLEINNLLKKSPNKLISSLQECTCFIFCISVYVTICTNSCECKYIHTQRLTYTYICFTKMVPHLVLKTYVVLVTDVNRG